MPYTGGRYARTEKEHKEIKARTEAMIADGERQSKVRELLTFKEKQALLACVSALWADRDYNDAEYGDDCPFDTDEEVFEIIRKLLRIEVIQVLGSPPCPQYLTIIED